MDSTVRRKMVGPVWSQFLGVSGGWLNEGGRAADMESS